MQYSGGVAVFFRPQAEIPAGKIKYLVYYAKSDRCEWHLNFCCQETDSTLPNMHCQYPAFNKQFKNM